MPKWEIDEDIVITGISGRFAESNNMQELRDHLMNNDDLITEDDRRWPPGLMGMPKRAGKIKDISKFDAAFFGISEKEVDKMDPQLRMLLEVTYEAIADAGYNPADLKSKNVGVFVGISASEYFEGLDHLPESVTAFAMTGCSRGLIANRVSFHFDFQGPSMALDTACASSLFAFDEAVLNLRNDRCESAIVAGLHLCMRPSISLGLHKLGVLSKDGKCHSFDKNADGYARSEAIVAVFLQRASCARRRYATVLNTKSNTDGYKDEGITFPSYKMQHQLLVESYLEAGINPNDVVYVEAHGTATPIGDPIELMSIGDFFCKNRNQPLLVGSVKSNYGHAEAASGLCSIAKVLISMEEGVIPANINFKTPNPNIPCLIDGRVKIVHENTSWHGGIVGINSFGFGGVNTHVILQSNPSPKVPPPLNYKEGPKLFLQSGRTKQNLDYILDVMERASTDIELYTLLSHLSNSPLETHHYRGYTILNGDKPTREVKQVKGRQQVWYVMTGLGCQWKGMAHDMMQVHVFRDTLIRAHHYLKPHHINLLDIIYSEDDKTWDSILYSLVALVSIQVALVNTLQAIGIEPDGIMGHSVGELSCGYADGCFTEEQTILAAYWRGKRLMDEPGLPVGLMASIGLSWEDAQKCLPPNVYLACNNAEDNVTISGLRSDVLHFLDELKEKDIFCRTVHSGNVAFHCKFVETIALKLSEILRVLTPNPKPRSSRWVSSSIVESQWNSSLAATFSAEYQVNNLVSTVLFYNAMTKVPKDAVVIEVGAHCLLEAIIKRNLGADFLYLGLQKKNENGLHHFMTQIGKFYIAGHDLKVHNIFEPVPLPVPQGTQMISPMIGWDHSHTYDLIPYQTFMAGGGTQQTVEVSIENENSINFYLMDYHVDSQILYPGVGYLVLVWKAFAHLKGVDYAKLPIALENVVFNRATILSQTSVTKFSVVIMDVGGEFELHEGGELVCNGCIYQPQDPSLQHRDEISISDKSSEYLKLTNKDFYKELRLKGYDYGPAFRRVMMSNNEGTRSLIRWDGNWVTFLDCAIQVHMMSKSTRNLLLPTTLEHLKINPLLHPNIPKGTEYIDIPSICDPTIQVVSCGGIDVKGLGMAAFNRRPPRQAANLERFTFVPFFEQNLNDVHSLHVLKSAVDIALENVDAFKIKAVEIGAAKGNLFTKVIPIINAQFETSAHGIVTDAHIENIKPEDVTKCCVDTIKWDFAHENAPPSISGVNLLYGHSILTSIKDMVNVLIGFINVLSNDGFLLFIEPLANQSFHSGFQAANLQVIAEKTSTTNSVLYLLRKVASDEIKTNVVIVNEGEYEKWVDPIRLHLNTIESKQVDERLWLMAHDKPTNGILGLVNCLRKEPGGNRVRAVYNPSLDSNTANKFLSNPIKALKEVYPDLLKQDLFTNVYKNGNWGTYRHVPITPEEKEQTVKTTNGCVNVLTGGDISSLRWVESPMRKWTETSTPYICQIYYSSLNFRDVICASRKFSPEAEENWANNGCLGMEFSGRDEHGHRIMACVHNHGLATFSTYNPVLAWEVPNTWSLDDAATVPICYLTVYYALVVKGKVRKNESILIHSGVGGIGQAAIAVALSYDCEVHTTVGSLEDQHILQKLYPNLNPNNIYNTRSVQFEYDVMNATNGRGVNLILYPPSADDQHSSIRCLAKNGRFMEIGNYDFLTNASFGMGLVAQNASFYIVYLDAVLERDHPHQQVLSDLLRKGIEEGVVKPLTRHIFNWHELETAFRFMASDKHMGKVLIKVTEEEPQNIVKNLRRPLLDAVPKTICSSFKSYIITGGLGGFGLEVGYWLVNHGAKYLVLSSRTGIRDGYQSRCIRTWRELGVTVLVSTADISTIEGSNELVNKAISLAPVAGIFNLAMVLKDALMENQTVDNYIAVAKPKVCGTTNLDVVSRKLCHQLDWFVAFSSLSCGKGNAGQTNYGYANSAMERVCEQRQLDGLAIQWGNIGDVGAFMEQMGGKAIVVGGTMPQTIHSCFPVLDYFLSQCHPIVSSFVYAEKNETALEGQKSLLDTIGSILGNKDLKLLNPNLTLPELGMDSIMGVEVKYVLEQNFDLVLNINQIRCLDIKSLQTIDTGEHRSTVSNGNAQPIDLITKLAIKKYSNEEVVIERYNFDNMIPTQCLLPMNMVTNGISIYIVHPIEGNLNSMLDVGSKLRCPAFGVQVSRDAPLNSLKDLAAYYIKQIKVRQPKGPYRLGGYSFGAAVMYEMVLQLQATGSPEDTVDNPIFFDSSPTYVKSYIDNEYLRKLENNELLGQEEVDALLLFVTQFMKFDYYTFKKELQSAHNWENRLQVAVNLLMKCGKFKCEEDAKFVATIYTKLGTAGIVYKPSGRVAGNATLIRATTPCLAGRWGEDYGLSLQVDGTVDLHIVPGTHYSFIYGDNAENVATIINSLYKV